MTTANTIDRTEALRAHLYQQHRQRPLSGEDRRMAHALALGRAFARFIETWAGAPAELACHAHLLHVTLELVESEMRPHVLAHAEGVAGELEHCCL